MNRILLTLVAFFATVPSIVLAQQTAPAPITDTSKRSDTTKKKSVFSLQTISATPLYMFEMNDNAMINALHQFSGIRPVPDSCHYPGELYLKNIRQLTFEGKNTRPSFSPDDRYIVFQAQGYKPGSCYQVYRMPVNSGVPAGRISSGDGRATGGAFLSGNEIVYSSTQSVNSGACPPEPKNGAWPIDNGNNLYIADSNGKQVQRLMDDAEHYAGDASVSPNGDRILFTSTRTGNAELFSMKKDGSDVTQLTHKDGFAGNASYSPNGHEIAFCSLHPTGHSLAEYKKSLEKGYIDPVGLEIYVMNADGTNERQLTPIGGTNCSPCWTPDGQYVVFSSNQIDPKGRGFDLYKIKSDGTGIERITYGGGFNGFPSFTGDGKHLVFSSSRNATHPGDVNIFVADWAP